MPAPNRAKRRADQYLPSPAGPEPVEWPWARSGQPGDSSHDVRNRSHRRPQPRLSSPPKATLPSPNPSRLPPSFRRGYNNLFSPLLCDTIAQPNQHQALPNPIFRPIPQNSPKSAKKLCHRTPTQHTHPSGPDHAELTQPQPPASSHQPFQPPQNPPQNHPPTTTKTPQNSSNPPLIPPPPSAPLHLRASNSLSLPSRLESLT
ncbi:hypothetical protein BH09VER1_BH09VER1_40580 [soil metagenome]